MPMWQSGLLAFTTFFATIGPVGVAAVFARHSGGTSAAADESEEAGHKDDISVFPLATR